MEDLASDLPSLDAVKNVWESEEGTMHFRRAMEGLSHTPTKSDYNTALAILAGRLLFRLAVDVLFTMMYGIFAFHICCFVFHRNGQRPGAITKMQRDEVE